MDWEKIKKDFLLSNYFVKRTRLFNKYLNTLNSSITSAKVNGELIAGGPLSRSWPLLTPKSAIFPIADNSINLYLPKKYRETLLKLPRIPSSSIR
jgi:hypothetical protein